jgi:hypothetical protein
MGINRQVTLAYALFSRASTVLRIALILLFFSDMGLSPSFLCNKLSDI